MSPRSLSVVVSGLADLGAAPDQAWTSLALEEFHKRLDSADVRSVVGVLWGVSFLMRPPEARGGPAAAAWRPPRDWSVRYAHILQVRRSAYACVSISTSTTNLQWQQQQQAMRLLLHMYCMCTCVNH
jgi:hypothetical protein